MGKEIGPRNMSVASSNLDLNCQQKPAPLPQQISVPSRKFQGGWNEMTLLATAVHASWFIVPDINSLYILWHPIVTLCSCGVNFTLSSQEIIIFKILLIIINFSLSLFLLKRPKKKSSIHSHQCG